MTGDASTLTVSAPKAYARRAGIEIETQRFDHPDPDHCEQGTASRAADDSGVFIDG